MSIERREETLEKKPIQEPFLVELQTGKKGSDKEQEETSENKEEIEEKRVGREEDNSESVVES